MHWDFLFLNQYFSLFIYILHILYSHNLYYYAFFVSYFFVIFAFYYHALSYYVWREKKKNNKFTTPQNPRVLVIPKHYNKIS